MREPHAAASPEESDPRRPWRVAVLVLVGCLTFLACYLRNFVLPFVPALQWSDQMLYATNGVRVVAGQMPYRDFFEFLPAGTDLTYAFLFRIFGVRLWIPNLVMDLLATAAVLLVTLAGYRVLREKLVFVPAAFAVGFGLYGGLDATHHWFSTVAALAAMVVLLCGTGLWHVTLAGALCGLMASFTQSKGAAVTLGFVVCLLWWSVQQKEPSRTRWSRCLLLCGSALIIFLILNLHYIVKLGLEEWCRWVIVFPFRYYPTVPGQTLSSPIIDFRSHGGWMKWIGAFFLYAVGPVAYASFLWLMRRKRDKEPDQPWDQLLLVAITGIAMFLAVAPSLSIMRASAVSFPATILLAWEMQQAPRALLCLKIAAVALAAGFALGLAIGAQRGHWFHLDLPAGETAIREPGKAELYEWLKEHTQPGQPYFGIAPISLPLWLQCPAPIHAPGPWEYYRPEHIARSIAALESYRIPVLVLRTAPQFQDAPGYEPEHLRAYQDYIRMHYRLTKRFPTGDEVWERIPDNQGPAN